MDAELKALLQQIASKLEGFDKRLTALEATAHEQVTAEELERRFKSFVPLSEMRFC